MMMKTRLNGVALTRDLVAFRTINPPGDERACAAYLADILTDAGFSCVLAPLADSRTNLIATIGDPDTAPLAFTGHIDTVPLGAVAWSEDPFAGEIKDGRLYGRGSSDMKSGVAAFVAAAVAKAALLAEGPGVTILITAGEETGCDGSLSMAASGLLKPAAALLVGEPTANLPMVGHKGALWLKAVTHGVTAHGSMPDKGDNAVYKVARAITRLSDFDFNVARHPVLGKPTVKDGTVSGGMNINSVPDRAEIAVDVRTIPGQDHADLREGLAGVIGEKADIETLFDLPGIWTDPAAPWAARVIALTQAVTGEAFTPQGAPYFTDASVLTPALGNPPTLILGPGEIAMAHQTDEYVEVARIEQAVEIYGRILDDWREPR
ncbi:MAG: M20 family metallopeptidase [Rhodospirillaceae bacterium]|nr:M20 family metallopeptidase [Rhodospirillaceae bacterium]